MIKPKYDLTGQQFGNWFVLGRSANMRSGSVRWSVRCSCGAISSRQSTPLRHGKSTCCWACATKKMVREGSGLRNRFCSYRANARLRSVEFTLTIEEFVRLTSQNCHYCGSKPKEVSRRRRYHQQVYLFNGIDRKDNSVGYTPENCLPCCEFCNFRKGKASYGGFVSWIRRLTPIWTMRTS